MELSLISKYRTQLMGIAILWVMLFHSGIHSGVFLLDYLASIGYGGVDIFLFLSGFGIYFSLNKKKEPIGLFYKKRLLRVLPYYYPVVLLYSIFLCCHGIWGWREIIGNMTMLGFWLGYGFRYIFDWYIPSLVVLYLITPFFNKYFQLNKNLVTILFCLIFYGLSFLLLGDKYSYLLIFTIRAPLYFFGFWFASFCNNNKNVVLVRYWLLVFSVLTLVFFSILYYIQLNYYSLWMDYGLAWFPFAVITIPLCFIVSYFFSLLKNYEFPIITFFGTYTLTLFIFHERIIASVYILGYGEIHYVKILIIIVTVIVAVLWQKSVKEFLAKYFN